MNRDNDFVHPMENAYEDEQTHSEPMLGWAILLVVIICVAAYFTFGVK